MRMREMAILLTLTVLVIVLLAIPLWWDTVQPILFGLPDSIQNTLQNMKDAFDYLSNEVD